MSRTYRNPPVTDFDRLIQHAMDEFWHTVVETQPTPIDFDVEREAIAHLPPKRVFETTLRVRYAGRAQPNITLELVDELGLWPAV